LRKVSTFSVHIGRKLLSFWFAESFYPSYLRKVLVFRVHFSGKFWPSAAQILFYILFLYEDSMHVTVNISFINLKFKQFITLLQYIFFVQWASPYRINRLTKFKIFVVKTGHICVQEKIMKIISRFFKNYIKLKL